jgi:lysophospholipase L1-like esterase
MKYALRLLFFSMLLMTFGITSFSQSGYHFVAEQERTWGTLIRPGVSVNTRVDLTHGPNNKNQTSYNYSSARKMVYPEAPFFSSSITLTYPNGGETLMAGSETDITWTGINLYDTVEIEYSVNGGAEWTPLGTVSPQTQSYTWTVPGLYSEECLVRLSSGSYGDQSDGAFTISNIQNKIHIVILGSSTAAGVGPDNPDSAWASRFEYALKQVNPEYEVINLAVSGYTTFQVLPTGYPIAPGISETVDVNRNITAALAYEPVAVIVNMPSNDALKYYPVRQQLDNLNAVGEAAALEEVLVWFTTSQPRNFTDPAQIAIQVALADTIKQVYESHAIDFWKGIADQNGYILPGYDSGDGIHLNNEAHRILFDRLWDKQIGTGTQ